jgi:hypothetical protein
MKIKITLAALAATTVLAVIPMTSAGATNYKGIEKVAKTLDSIYAQVRKDLGNRSSTDTINALFVKYSNECILLASYGSRNNSQVSLDILNVAKIGNAWAWTGYYTLNTPNVGMSLWKQANNRLNAAESKFAKDVSVSTA